MSLRKEYQAMLRMADNEKNAEFERLLNGELPWGVYGSHLSEYSRRFKAQLGSLPFADLFAQKHDEKGSCSVLELGGDGSIFTNQPQISCGVAVTLNDFRINQRKLEDAEKNRVVVEGNLMKNQTWKNIETSSPKGKYDYVLLSPIGGWKSLAPNNMDSFLYAYHYLANSWRLLDDQGEVFFDFELFNYFGLILLNESLFILNSQYGIPIDYQNHRLRVSKTENCPERLPSSVIIARQLGRRE